MNRKDRLVEDETRRRQGAFFTPRLWADEAHAELVRVLGPNWRQECIVWDPAAGTANLTRDYHDWGQLISSTVERPDVQVMKDQGWGGDAFQYDFLNPGAESPFFEPEDQDKNVIPPAVDKVLREAAAAGKRLVFFMNPPYGTAGVYQTYTTEKGQKRSTIRKGIAKTVVNGEMKAAKLGAPSQQLYAQFMFRCSRVAEEYGFTNATVAVFSVPTFMCSGSYRKLRGWWYGRHAYQGGFLFQASHFADVSGRWGISFTVWDSGGTTDPKAELPIRLADERGFAVVTTGGKAVYNSDGHEVSKWVREQIKGVKGADAPQLSSGLKVVGKGPCTPPANHLGFMADKSNSVMYSNDETYLLSSGSNRNRGFPLIPGNWRRAVALYGARKLVLETWDTQKDEYLVPDEAAPGYEQWVNDCHVYTLLHRHNNCTAMRDVPYKDKLWRIKNHWFWRTREDTLKSLDTPDTSMLYRDAQAEPLKSSDVNPITGEDETQPWEITGDPYFAHVRPSLNLSPEAQRVMNLVDALWLKSLPVRESYAAGKPELHLTTWDAGLYQLKHLWRDLFPTEWKELQAAFKVLSNKLRPGVYDFGFLK